MLTHNCFKCWILSIGLLFLMGCESTLDETNSKNVVCTTNILANTVRQLLPDDIDVVSLMGPGVDPHLYKAGQGDLEILQEAGIIIENGLHLEGKMAEVFKKLQKYKPVISASDGIEKGELIQIEKEVYDPHIWFDVQMWKMSSKLLSERLALEFPDRSEEISRRSDFWASKLDSLHLWIRKEIEQLPKNRRVLVTAHDAFSYFGRAYGIEVKGLQGISTQSEYGLKDVSDLVDYLAENKVPAVFVETSVSEKSLVAVIEGCKRKNHNVIIGGQLYSDALGGKEEPGDNYKNMVSHNVKTIVGALNSGSDEG
ncbi:MAG: zinc ABC transporter substrate-binding protein [Schleiferiaceae bacterium]|nr:zinc ABC transporter substrate-binding protein [Schleiferiaceae bacterium]